MFTGQKTLAALVPAFDNVLSSMGNLLRLTGGTFGALVVIPELQCRPASTERIACYGSNRYSEPQLRRQALQVASDLNSQPDLRNEQTQGNFERGPSA
jgi:hypothetical protein